MVRAHFVSHTLQLRRRFCLTLYAVPAPGASACQGAHDKRHGMYGPMAASPENPHHDWTHWTTRTRVFSDLTPHHHGTIGHNRKPGKVTRDEENQSTPGRRRPISRHSHGTYDYFQRTHRRGTRSRVTAHPTARTIGRHYKEFTSAPLQTYHTCHGLRTRYRRQKL